MKVCIVGYGSIGKRHHEILVSLLHPDTEYTICDVNFGAKIEEVCISVSPKSLANGGTKTKTND